jgi:uncharacterized protein
MKNIESLFGESPYGFMVAHADKVRECINLVKPVSEAVLAGDMDAVLRLQKQVSGHEYEADQARSAARKRIGRRLFLSVERADLREFLRQLDRMGDDAEAFALRATFRPLRVPPPLHAPFRALVAKVVEVSCCALDYSGQLDVMERESFSGPESRKIQESIDRIGYMEWESDQRGHVFRRALFSEPDFDPVSVLLLDQMTASLLGIADHADNVGHCLGLMIKRR